MLNHLASGAKSAPNFPLHFHSVNRRFGCGTAEVAEFLGPECTALDAIILYFQSTSIFLSWTSRVRSPPPAPRINSLEMPTKRSTPFIPLSPEHLSLEQSDCVRTLLNVGCRVDIEIDPLGAAQTCFYDDTTVNFYVDVQYDSSEDFITAIYCSN